MEVTTHGGTRLKGTNQLVVVVNSLVRARTEYGTVRLVEGDFLLETQRSRSRQISRRTCGIVYHAKFTDPRNDCQSSSVAVDLDLNNLVVFANFSALGTERDACISESHVIPRKSLFMDG